MIFETDLPAQSLTTANHQRTRILIPYYVEDPSHRKPVLILSIGLSKPEEQAHDRNEFLQMGRIHTHVFIDRPASYC